VPHLVILITIESILVQAHVEGIITQQPVLGSHIQNHRQYSRWVEASCCDIQIQLACMSPSTLIGQTHHQVDRCKFQSVVKSTVVS